MMDAKEYKAHIKDDGRTIPARCHSCGRLIDVWVPNSKNVVTVQCDCGESLIVPAPSLRTEEECHETI